MGYYHKERVEVIVCGKKKMKTTRIFQNPPNMKTIDSSRPLYFVTNMKEKASAKHIKSPVLRWYPVLCNSTSNFNNWFPMEKIEGCQQSMKKKAYLF